MPHTPKYKNLNPEEFKRFCGVYPETFKDMVKVLAAEKAMNLETGGTAFYDFKDISDEKASL